MYEIVKVCQRTTFEAIRPEVTCESIYLGWKGPARAMAFPFFLSISIPALEA